ncbi:amidohydrolase [Parahaliea maris]|uniref:Amidohydrolase n=1 Tax=Parahaliea maris TaxID=2716870 RepID=A0A5C8ZU80_9GAMM|nr:amidohydrolase [Parahaliea maris]TXS92063.1 amidohydrolase [Parahaliea maris]
MQAPAPLKALFRGALLGATLLAPLAGNAAEPTAQQQAILDAVQSRAKQAQVMNDMIFSFGELGFQEFESSRYLAQVLEDNGFTVERGMAGIPTAWMASWGSGKPVIALGSDIDGIPKASQKPGVAYHDPIVEGAPGHGEGHNSGLVLNIISALAVKEYMEENGLKGTIRIWPGIAEEQLATKAYYVRAGYFKDIDAVLYAHVGSDLGTMWGGNMMSGMVSVKYNFHGVAAHGAMDPWSGRSALDAVELMDVGLNFRREHLRLQQRTHGIITDGGDQPNVVPSEASVWYFFRETDYEHIMDLWATGDKIANGAAMMTDTTWDSEVLGSAWPIHLNKPMAEEVFNNTQLVGLPEWSDDDQKLAKALQSELGFEPVGLKTEMGDKLMGGFPAKMNYGGGSDDIGDISWNVPTSMLFYPANMPNIIGHHWSSGVAMATPIAHKGVVAGAKTQALTLLSMMTKPELLKSAWTYFDEVQTKDVKYTPLIREEDQPATWLNRDTMKIWRSDMQPYYYNPEKYDTYLEQLGIDYPTIR